MISTWATMGPSIQNAYWARVEAEQNEEDYSGPMDDQSYAILNTFADADAVQPMYKKKGNQPFTLYILNFPDEQTAADALAYLDATWPGNQVDIEGAWYIDTGIQMGQEGVYDEETGELIDITGTPTWPIPSNLYQIMPDTIVYDEEGEPVDTIPPTSNDDLRDVNILAGQAPRFFTDNLDSSANAGPGGVGVSGMWPIGYGIRLTLTLTDPDGDVDTQTYEWVAERSVNAMFVKQALVALLDPIPHWRADMVGTRVRITPASDDYSGQVGVEVITP